MATHTEGRHILGEKKAQETEYVILEQRIKPAPPATVNTSGTADPPGEYWRHAGRKTARSADEAIRQHAGENAGTYIAVPARSWQPRTVKVETKKIVHLA